MPLDRTARAILDERGTPYVLIGAMALGVHGMLRATHDTDFLTTDRTVLDPSLWTRCEAEGATVKIMRGDQFDPLAGTVRIVRHAEQVDVVVGKYKWEQAIIGRAEEYLFNGVRTRVPRAGDLVLLKLAAGGPKDAWDIHELMNHIDRAATIREIDARIDELPERMQQLWTRLRSEISTATSG